MAFGLYSLLGNEPRQNALIHPTHMPAVEIDPRAHADFLDARFAGIAIEKFSPNDLKDNRRGLVAQMVLEKNPNGAHTKITSTHSLATLEKFGHEQAIEIKTALYKSHNSSRELAERRAAPASTLKARTAIAPASKTTAAKSPFRRLLNFSNS